MALRRVTASAGFLLRGVPRGAPYPPHGGPDLLRCTVGMKPYSSHVKTKAGVLIPSALAPKASTSERVIKFVKKTWQGVDERLKDLAVKGVILAMGGGGTAVMLTRTLLQRMDELEARVNQSIKEVQASVTDLKVQVGKSDAEANTIYNTLQAQVNSILDLLKEGGVTLAKDER